jgi:hypothetical protein
LVRCQVLMPLATLNWVSWYVPSWVTLFAALVMQDTIQAAGGGRGWRRVDWYFLFWGSLRHG